MTAKEFVIENAKVITERFPITSCRYQIDEFEQSHYIEVLPKQIFESSDDFALFQCDVISEFMDEFPNQSIIFITEGDLVEISDVVFSISGKLSDQQEFIMN